MFSNRDISLCHFRLHVVLYFHVEVLKGSTQRWRHRTLLRNWVSNLFAIATYVRVFPPLKERGKKAVCERTNEQIPNERDKS